MDSCPDCNSQEPLKEAVTQISFVLGATRSRPEVTLEATGPLFICEKCGFQCCDWRMERAKALAMSDYSYKNARENSVDPPEELRIGHALAALHRQQIESTKLCACFYCLQTFEGKEVEEWVDSGRTALCPKCGIDSVLPIISQEGKPEITPEFVKNMQQFWFDSPVKKQQRDSLDDLARAEYEEGLYDQLPDDLPGQL